MSTNSISRATSEANGEHRHHAPVTHRKILRIVTLMLGILFLLSAALNLGVKIPLGIDDVSFSSPSPSIAGFEIVIGVFLLAAAIVSTLYVFGGVYLLTTVGIVEGLLSPQVEGLARNIHETMVPFAAAGWILFLLEVKQRYRIDRGEANGQRRWRVVGILQFFVGGLVTLGGAGYAASGTYPVGTAIGIGHLVVGLSGLFAGYAFVRRKDWSWRFVIGINVVTIAYSTFAESLAEIYALLPPGINDALIGTMVAVVASVVILYLLLGDGKPIRAELRIPQ